VLTGWQAVVSWRRKRGANPGLTPRFRPALAAIARRRGASLVLLGRSGDPLRPIAGRLPLLPPGNPETARRTLGE